jgi:hypothetical protein
MAVLTIVRAFARAIGRRPFPDNNLDGEPHKFLEPSRLRARRIVAAIGFLDPPIFARLVDVVEAHFVDDEIGIHDFDLVRAVEGVTNLADDQFDRLVAALYRERGSPLLVLGVH